MEFRTLWTKPLKVSQGPGKEPSLTQQHEAAACDINNILKRYVKTGILPSMGEGQFIDVTGVDDYRHALELLQNANDAFDGLGARVREHFNNDPQELIAAAFDPKRQKEFEELGLTVPKEPKKEESVTPPVAKT